MAFLYGELVDNRLPFVNLFHRVSRQPVFSRDGYVRIGEVGHR